MPSHCTFLQSPAVWLVAGSGVPAATLVTTHSLFVQANVRQSVLVPQLAAVRQPTQAPPPVHIWLVPQAVPAARFGFEGTPAVQMSLRAHLAVGG